MKKFLVLAMAATLLMAGSAFAVQRNLGAAQLKPTPELTFTTGQPATTNNADSCDIGVTPAATLLLPYFEVDTAAAQGTGSTTLFTITNTSRYPQIAHVTVWTDWSFPVLDFNIFLTGYDVQGINLFDVIVRGIIVPGGPPPGTSITTVPGSPQPAGSTAGATPFNNTSNPNFILDLSSRDVRTTCANLPGSIDPALQGAILRALTTGTGYVGGAANCGSGAIGSNTGTRAKGYVTVDVASYCSQQLPTDPTYYSGGVASILFDNTLIGDYQQIGPTPAGSGTAASFDAQGNPMVHIRAIPEGGLSGAGGGSTIPTNLPFTFYDRYTSSAASGAVYTVDRRVPLPSEFAARWIEGGVGAFSTDYKIWREGVRNTDLSCSSSQYAVNSALLVTAVVRFDEHENSYGSGVVNCVSPCGASAVVLPESSRTNTTNANVYPRNTGTDVGGWMFLNLDNQRTSTSTGVPVTFNAYTEARLGFGPGPINTRGGRNQSQNWVIVSMFGAVGANRLSVDFDAAWLGNGCTPAEGAGAQIAPSSERGGQLICPAPFTPGVAPCGAGTQPPVVNP